MKLNLLWATLRLMTRFPVPEKWADGVEFRQLG
ncbi:adenosylcobinamide-GDP ribazoletransferase, partial [Escherichia coli]|nr:adenosylcobinamide-GDP ribazoletransferase [Escherichia coli]